MIRIPRRGPQPGNEDPSPALAMPVPVRTGSLQSRLDGNEDGDGDGDDKSAVVVREISRTPSPTPSEARMLSEPARLIDWRRTWRALHWRKFADKRRLCVYCNPPSRTSRVLRVVCR